MNNKAIIEYYVAGFTLSILLTLGAYFAVANSLLSGGMLVAAIIFLALIQVIVQLIFFLHLGQEPSPRWNLSVFLSTISIILIIVLGSIWIMKHLNYNMTPADMSSYLINQEAIGK